jgi:hypothetical protein
MWTRKNRCVVDINASRGTFGAPRIQTELAARTRPLAASASLGRKPATVYETGATPPTTIEGARARLPPGHRRFAGSGGALDASP